jgi:hypothetical protein
METGGIPPAHEEQQQIEGFHHGLGLAASMKVAGIG